LAEGDTIVRAARRIEAAIAGDAVAVSMPNPRGRAVGVERLDGLVFEGVETKGKNLLLRFGELSLHSHLGMNGSWHAYPAGGRWAKPRRSAWAALRGERGEAVQFGGSTLRVMPTVAGRRELARLGPDILAPDLDLGEAVASVRAAGDRTLGDVLLDQSRIAGIGNIFKSEACFAARLDPWRRVDELDDEELLAVLDAARTLMQASVASGRPVRSVYKRAGRPCPVCRTAIRSRGQGDANRTTYWCPSCQSG
jgi:endonuclease VIII